MKINKKGMVARIVAIALAVFSFVGMAFKFFGMESIPKNQTYGMGDWFDVIESGSKVEADGFVWWQIAKVLMIITLVVVAILAVIAIVQFFVKNKVLNLLMKVAGLVCVVAALIFVVTYVVGVFAIDDSLLVGAGPFVLGLSAMGASVAGLLSAKK